MEADRRRLAGDTARAATSDEVKGLRREFRDLKEFVSDGERSLAQPLHRDKPYILSFNFDKVVSNSGI